jgi:hypothetical protein
MPRSPSLLTTARNAASTLTFAALVRHGLRTIPQPPIARSRMDRAIERAGATGLEPATSGVRGRKRRRTAESE